MPIGHVVIVGLMGVGKTSVGRRLAFRLGWQFVDSDATLAEQTGETARAIAAARSLDELHALEAHALLTALANRAPSVIGAAASTIEQPSCRAALAEPEVFVAWLRAPTRLLSERVTRAGHRPLVDDASSRSRFEVLTAQAARREPLFEGVADVVVDVASRAPSKSAKEIEAAVRARR